MAESSSALFIFEIANNHQGDVEHGKRIIEEMAKLCRRHGMQGAMKFQLRQLASFIHPHHRDPGANKHIQRFLETEMPLEGFAALVATTREAGLLPMCTVFDEASIQPFLTLGFEILKIGSCSARDYPLLRALRVIRQPVILSTAGLSLAEVERAVWELDRKPEDLAIMHCVGLYPCAGKNLMLDRITELKKRFPRHRIGFSTHEDPEALLPVQIASALGATIFEKHVGLATDKYSLNAYSAAPEAVDRWMQAYRDGLEMRAFSPAHAREVHAAERVQLRTLERMAYLREDVRKGTVISPESICFAIPQFEGQASAEEVHGTEIVADRDYQAGLPLSRAALGDKKKDGGDAVLMEYTRLTLASGISPPENTLAEVSCHFGLDQLSKNGALLITLFNESVCKKFVLLSSGQFHPMHQHSDREEFMRTLHGDAEIQKEEKWEAIPPQGYARTEHGQWHALRSLRGGVIEEITTHYGNMKSRYADPGARSNKIKVVWRGDRWQWLGEE
jgi:sialic acid synthase SpsE